MKHDHGPWLQTFTGRKYYPLAPRPEEVHLDDIAHALGMQCRFNGHCKFHYSVAQHSIYVSQLVPPEFALEALLHDATEAYLGDIIRPIKTLAILRPFNRLEDLNWRNAIAPRFGLPEKISKCVHEADTAMLLAERDQVMSAVPDAWEIVGEPAKIKIDRWDPNFAGEVFLSRFDQLTASR